MKITLKRALSVMLTLAMLLSTAVFSSAATVVESGKCGNNVTYELYDNGELIIRGSGSMDDYYSYIGSPFHKNNNIKKVVIDDGVNSIGIYAFSDCKNLTSVTIPGSVTTVGGGAFEGCLCLESINIDSSNTEYCSLNGILFNKDKNIIIRYPEGKTGSCSIPSTVTSISAYAFFDCKGLTSVTIPDSVTSIGFGALFGCEGLTSVTVPSSVTSIEWGVFRGCKGLTSVTIPDSVTSIGNEAFRECSNLKNVYYSGTKAQWNSISIDSRNEALLNADIHFNFSDDYGDADKDGSVTAADARHVLRASVGLEEKTAELISIADMDNDGNITAADARLILRKSVGLGE